MLPYLEQLFENVFLNKFDKTKFCCDENAVNEYNFY